MMKYIFAFLAFFELTPIAHPCDNLITVEGAQASIDMKPGDVKYACKDQRACVCHDGVDWETVILDMSKTPPTLVESRVKVDQKAARLAAEAQRKIDLQTQGQSVKPLAGKTVYTKEEQDQILNFLLKRTVGR